MAESKTDSCLFCIIALSGTQVDGQTRRQTSRQEETNIFAEWQEVKHASRWADTQTDRREHDPHTMFLFIARGHRMIGNSIVS